MKHFENLKHSDLYTIETGEYFTYKTNSGHYRKGLIVFNGCMIPIGLYCKTIDGAQKQN